ncbi:MAG: hypothetical protein R8F63_07650 [Acidimicrobiales bacterium]|nr:hypothetical protein [Acidimicrobiales bacterium]
MPPISGPADRRRRWTPREQILAIGPLLFFWTLTATLLWVSAEQDVVPTERLFLDAASVADEPWYTGLLHEIGVLGWTVAATAALAGAFVASLASRRRAAWFLGSGALLTIVLLTDDLTGFHSEVGPRIGLPKFTTIGAILGGSVVWVLLNWREISRTRWLILLSSLGALALSVLVDVERRTSDVHIFFEDAPKLFGIVGWATYFVFTSIDLTRSAVGRRVGGEAA